MYAPCPLGHAGDARLAGQVQVALVGFDLAHQRGEQGGFAGAVAADQRDALARLEREGRAVEQRHMAVGQMGPGEAQQRHQ